jgi:hypothetical protein
VVPRTVLDDVKKKTFLTLPGLKLQSSSVVQYAVRSHADCALPDSDASVVTVYSAELNLCHNVLKLHVMNEASEVVS